MNYKEARIPLELAHELFGHTKSYPLGLVAPEVEKCEFAVLSDGTAEVSWLVRTDYDGSAAMLPPTGPSYVMRLHVGEEALLDCIAHSGAADVVFGKAGEKCFIELECARSDISDDYVKDVLWEYSRQLVLSYICLFPIGGKAQ